MVWFKHEIKTTNRQTLCSSLISKIKEHVQVIYVCVCVCVCVCVFSGSSPVPLGEEVALDGTQTVFGWPKFWLEF